jgi:hexapeptide transferase family protein
LIIFCYFTMFNAIYFYRFSRWLYLYHIPVIPKLITLIIFLIYNSKIPYQAKIGKGTKFGYGGMGVVIHSDAEIGDYCTIGQQVTIGGGNSRYPGLPKIGNNVAIHKGVIVFGGITVGDNVEIGANAVVNKPVPNDAIVAGVPAKIIRIKDANN